MPVFGAHMSVAGGPANAVAAAVTLGCDTLQIFTKNPNVWDAKPIPDEEAAAFQVAVRNAGLKYSAAHDSYLINLAAPDDALFRRSVDAFVAELERAEALRLDSVVTHPGAHTGSGEEAGLARVVSGLNEARRRTAGYRVRVLIETTAGQGTYLGGRFEHLRAILDSVTDADWLGVCLDTCHLFAAGYDLRTPEQYAETFDEFDQVIGLHKIELFHLNDSEGEWCSCVDRHAGVGRGRLGLDAFRRLVTDPRFADHPMILETPKEDDDGTAMDPVNLAILRGFVAAGSG